MKKENSLEKWKTKIRLEPTFQKLRDMWGINHTDFTEELLNHEPSHKGAGKSGMDFWYSKTRKYLLKSITKPERLILANILEGYLEYMNENPSSCLPKFLGLYKGPAKGRVAGGVKGWFFVQPNILGQLDPKKVRTFDLKGSKRKRFSPPEVSVKKDCNLGDVKIAIEGRDILQDQLSRDTGFLSKHKLMDYSLLLFIQSKDVKHAHCEHTACVFSSATHGCVPACIEFGIIDVLQRYNIKKMAESFWRTKNTSRSKSEVSAVNHRAYRKRFLRFSEKLWTSTSGIKKWKSTQGKKTKK